MNLVSFSIKTKGVYNFAHRLRTVFTRFGISEARTRKALQTIVDFIYESNEAVLHDVIDFDTLSPLLKNGYEKSLALFQAIPCSIYSLRPHFEGSLLRIPTSIPDDEMVFDRLRITAPKEVGRICGEIMPRVYELGGVYALNLHRRSKTHGSKER